MLCMHNLPRVTISIHDQINYSLIASVTIETVLIYSNFIIYKALATDPILIKTWTLGHYDI